MKRVLLWLLLLSVLGFALYGVKLQLDMEDGGKTLTLGLFALFFLLIVLVPKWLLDKQQKDRKPRER